MGRKKPIERNRSGTISSPFSSRVDIFIRLPLSLPFYLLLLPKAFGFCCSPYSTTILLSTPEQGKLTVKADLVFEEYSKLLVEFMNFDKNSNASHQDSFCCGVHAVGIDLHQKIIVVKEINSKPIHARGSKQPSSFPLHKDVYVIDDDNEDASHAPAEGLNVSKKSKREMDSL